MKGYSGKILHVDLTARSVSIEEPPEKFYRQYVGGACMGAYYLLKETPGGIDALSPENVIAVNASALNGAPISGSARHCITTKSPLTGTIMSSEGGGYWAPQLRFAGFDGIIIKGKADKPVYLWINDGECEIRDASSVWGKVTGDAQDAIREELGNKRVRVLGIGPAGENLVRFAGVSCDLRHFNGRGGVGAVFGSKNLKAIAALGSAKPEFDDLETIKQYAKKYAQIVKTDEFLSLLQKLGTTMNVEWMSPVGGLPTNNWRAGNFEDEANLTAENYHEEMMGSVEGCWACTMRCKRSLKEGVKQPYEIDAKYGGPEYETIGMCGSNLMSGDLNAISKVNEIASKYGMDTITLGGVIGLAMECYQKGLLSKEDTGGIEVKLGDSDTMVKLAEMTGKREGFGDALAEGTARLAAKLGPEAERVSVTVKGKEFPAHMPRMKSVLSLAYACNPFGPDHMSCEHDPVLAPGALSEIHRGFGFYETADIGELNFEKAKLMAYTQRSISALDSFSVCHFCFNSWAPLGFDALVECVNAATGWKYTLYEFMLLGERRVNLMRVFNQREGFTSADDMLPERLFSDPLSSNGETDGRTIDKEKFLKCRDQYYRLNNWDPETGNPTEVKLMELGLGWVTDLL